MRLQTVPSVLIDQLPSANQAPLPAEQLTSDVLRNFVELGRITYTDDLLVAGARPEHLEQQPLPILVVGVRGDKGEPFGMSVMQALNPHYTVAQLLQSPLGEQLTPELACFIRLDAQELKTLKPADVRALGWPLSRWYGLFGVGVDFFTSIGMRAREFRMDSEEALATAVLPDDSGEPIFKILL
jgi:hypothetical protein